MEERFGRRGNVWWASLADETASGNVTPAALVYAKKPSSPEGDGVLTDSAQLSLAESNKLSSAQCNATHNKIIAWLSAGVALILGRRLKTPKPKTPLCEGAGRTPHVFPHVILRGRVSVSTSRRGRRQPCGVRARIHAPVAQRPPTGACGARQPVSAVERPLCLAPRRR